MMDKYYEIAPPKIIRAGSDTFTYRSHASLPIGSIVTISIGTKNYFGVVIKEVKKPTYKTKTISGIEFIGGIPPALVETAQWVASYYNSPLAHVIALLLPAGLAKKRRPQKPLETPTSTRRIKRLTPLQKAASTAISSNPTKTSLLHGITGSGKTQIYIDQARQQSNNGRSAIILVPEISLTPQLVSEVSLHFPNLIAYHSKLTQSQKHLIWLEVINATEPLVVIGARSALFLPIKKLGLIAIDEAHEPSYQQAKTPRYSALRVARVLATNSKATLVLGSATPLVTDYYMAKKGGQIITLDKAARENITPPSISLLDMTDRNNFKKHRFLSDQLLSEIEQTKGQTLIYHNRRGSASITLCETCGWTALDPITGTPLTLHLDKNKLINHLTNQSYPIPHNCPSCKEPNIVHKGIGTKLIEQELRKLFPNKKIMRFDGDNAASDTLEKSYEKVLAGEIDVIIGTQVIAKGLDLPHLKTVAIIQADSGLAIPDFASNERTFQLLSQVVGRVGRNENNTKIIVQTYQPNSEIINLGIQQDYKNFYNLELATRQKDVFPPYCFLLKLTCSYKTEAAAISNAKTMATKIKESYPNVQLFGPAPSFYEKHGDKFRWQIVIKAKKRSTLQEIAKLAKPPYWQFEIDPTSLL